MPRSLLIILGNQLFPREHLAGFRRSRVFMAEDHGLCTHFRYHKHKIILFLAAMRAYAEELSVAGFEVTYHKLSDPGRDLDYETKLAGSIELHKIDELVTFEVEDKFFEQRLRDFAGERKLSLRVLPTPMFVTSREEFADYLHSVSKPFMKSFYERQRRRLGILVEADGKPTGGRFSFDVQNRRPLPRNVNPPAPRKVTHTQIAQDVLQLVDELFPEHPGSAGNFWVPTTRRQALAWLDEFLAKRLALFGPYEDAIAQRSTFVYHSALSPLLNLGLLTPGEVIAGTLESARKFAVPIESLEGFVRQVIGWREFIRGLYQNYSEREEKANFWKHRRKLSAAWYRGDTGIPVLDTVLHKVIELGWCHHIERLMVLSNLMLLCEVDPREAHRWFMEMFIDSSDWVMGPNVYGMGQLSDGGIFATKPYICGSNYLRKMGGLPNGPWCDIIDGLYWSFIDKHREYFARNPRTTVMIKALDRLDSERRGRLFRLAKEFRERVTTSG